MFFLLFIGLPVRALSLPIPYTSSSYFRTRDTEVEAGIRLGDDTFMKNRTLCQSMTGCHIHTEATSWVRGCVNCPCWKECRTTWEGSYAYTCMTYNCHV